jgi:cytochrome c oxidase subunit 2
MRAAIRVAGLIGLLVFSAQALADYQLNMTPGVTTFSKGAYDIHMLVMWICVGIGAVVFGAMIYSIINHRKSKGAVAADFHESTKLELFWTIIPFLILIVMAIPATRVLLAESDVSNPDMSIKITGYQWKWNYDYNVGKQAQPIQYFSNITTPDAEHKSTSASVPKNADYIMDVDNPMVIPVNEKVRLMVTSNDVIHSWWVPKFGVKKDAIPGYINEVWVKVPAPGVYRGRCAELCGTNHAFMPIVVIAKSKEDYAAWVASKKAASAKAAASANKVWTKDELYAQGKKVFDTTCAACHQANGMGIPGAFPPLVDGQPFAASKTMTDALVAHHFYKDGKIVLGPVHNHISIVLDGIAGTAMQAFGNQLSDVDIASVITYERNSWGNKTGDTVQPSQIAAERGKK